MALTYHAMNPLTEGSPLDAQTEPRVTDELIPAIYEELRRLAAR
jgi:hypothetical protein